MLREDKLLFQKALFCLTKKKMVRATFNGSPMHEEMYNGKAAAESHMYGEDISYTLAVLFYVFGLGQRHTH